MPTHEKRVEMAADSLCFAWKIDDGNHPIEYADYSTITVKNKQYTVKCKWEDIYGEAITDTGSTKHSFYLVGE